MRGLRARRVAALCLLILWPSLAAAQARPGDATMIKPIETGVKGDLTLMVSGGLDLDFLGEVLGYGVSCDPDLTEGSTACSQQTRIVTVDRLVHWPDAYSSLPTRATATLGVGIFNKDELIVSVSMGRATGVQNLRVGEVISLEGRRNMNVAFSQYKDRTIEGGLRHYLKAVGTVKGYVNLTYGIRQIEAITGTFAGSGNDGNVGTLRLYDKATLPTAGIVFGAAFERGRLGFFVESGFRWTRRMTRQDDDLRPLAMEAINNTTQRVFLPANLGLVLRF
jgi:hypothetical protein